MASKIIIKVTKGAPEGKEYIYDSKEQLFVGRQEDCAIVLPIETVSRYHCMLEVTPPNVTVRDFGSLNGTFLNGEKIGQRDKAMSAEDAQKEYHEEFELHDGDTLGLSKNCELTLQTVLGKRCAECQEELPEDSLTEGSTVSDDAPRIYVNNKGEVICEGCHLKHEASKKDAELASLENKRIQKEKEAKEQQEKARLEQERLERERAEAEKQRKHAEEKAAELAKKLKDAADRAAREAAEKQRKEAEAKAEELKKAEAEKQRRLEQQCQEEEERRRREEQEKQRLEAERKRLEELKNRGQKKCADCGVLFIPKGEDNNLCPKCVEDRGKILEVILMQALGDAFAQQPQKDNGPAVVRGYRKVKRLGAGGMGEVWLVREEATGKQYALKTMLPQAAANKNAKETFLREAMLGEALDHKNVIKVYKTGCESNVFYILMELCDGGSVDKLMERQGGKLPLDLATYIILQVLDGLEYAHHADVSVKCGWRTREATGVVHRDFKPANIFLADNNKFPVAKVADFGLAKSFEMAGLSKHTRTGTAAGTPVFQPRQQIENFKYSKPDVDVWAAAASYYNMLTGNIPKDIRGHDIWMAMYTANVVPIRQRNPQIPEKLAAVIDKALQEKPEIGIKSAKELKKRIVEALPEDVRKAVKGVTT